MEPCLHFYSVLGTRSEGGPLFLTKAQEHAISQYHLRLVLKADVHLGHDCQFCNVTFQGASCPFLKNKNKNKKAQQQQKSQGKKVKLCYLVYMGTVRTWKTFVGVLLFFLSLFF